MLPQASIVDTKETLYNVQSKAIGENCKWIFVPAHVSDEWTGSSARNSTRFRPRKISTSHHRIISKFADQIIQKLMYSIPKSRFRSDHAGNELRIRHSLFNTTGTKLIRSIASYCASEMQKIMGIRLFGNFLQEFPAFSIGPLRWSRAQNIHSWSGFVAKLVQSLWHSMQITKKRNLSGHLGGDAVLSEFSARVSSVFLYFLGKLRRSISPYSS